ncbi:MAG: HAMP domain-containing histidine kinase [Xanthomonadaceae bacterium]|nr:HAMP domain-containing histidine kinase [Xanthomonadaceae bacterium]
MSQSSPHADDPRQAASPAEREHAFTRAASHELRTPLTVIRVASDLLSQDERLSSASRRSLGRIQDAVSAMEALLDALLLLARSEDCAPECVDVQVLDVVEQELERVRPLLLAKQLQVSVEHTAAPQLHAPPAVLQVILGNLLANAVRYTDQGEVRVRVGADRVSVEDTGIGMDAQALALAHAPFFCVRSGLEGGPGLGLAVAKRLALRCGWTLALDSAPGQGTRACLMFGATGQD